MKKIIGMLFAVVSMAGVASATLLVSVDSPTNTVGGSTVTIEATELGGGFPNSGGRWGSVTNIGTDVVATVPASPPKTDFYFQWSGLSSLGMLASEYRYAEVHYSLSDDWDGTTQKLRLGDTVDQTGGAGANDPFSNPELLNASGNTAGTHKFIIDLTADITLSGNWNYLRWNMFNGSVSDGGKSVTLDKIVFGTEVGDFSDVYYVASTPSDWTDSAAWSDGSAAHSGGLYFVTNNVVLQTPSTTATFPGDALSLADGQRLELMVTGSDVITIAPLSLGNGAELVAGVAGAGEAQIDGAISLLGDILLSGATNDLRVLAEVSGGNEIELSAPANMIYVDNTNNTFNGTWLVAEGTTEFAAGTAVGFASIEVQSNGTLQVLGGWDGTSRGGGLTVVDSPNAVVNLAADAWAVGALTVGTSNLVNGTYTVSELNSIIANAVFTGTGTIEVGLPLTTYYLQDLIPANQWIGQREFWFDAPSFGNRMPTFAPFAGNTFDVNGISWRAANSTSTTVFEGHLLVSPITGADVICLAYGSDFQLNGGVSIVSEKLVLRPHRVPAGTTMSELDMNGSASLLVRALEAGGSTFYENNLSIGTLTGTGTVIFGRTGSYDSNGLWSFAVTGTDSPFSGTVSLVEGELTLDSDVVLTNASFEVETTGNSLVLSNNLAVASFSYGATTLTTGIYTAAELNTLFGTDSFSGNGLLSFEYISPIIDYTPPMITGVLLSGSDAVVSGTSSSTNASAEYRLQVASDLVSSNWVPVATNVFDESGDFSVTYPLSGGDKAFYRLEVGE